jgi:hypothetical protein
MRMHERRGCFTPNFGNIPTVLALPLSARFGSQLGQQEDPKRHLPGVAQLNRAGRALADVAVYG